MGVMMATEYISVFV